MKRTPFVNICIIVTFLLNSFGNVPLAQADEYRLPVPGVMVRLSPPLDPPMLKGIKVHPDDPFRFDFILDKGDSELSNEELKDESSKLIKYFLASLTIPEKDLWVNLSPYEKDRIIPQSFGLTEMGRDLLGEDYMLKQITASLIYPEDAVGKKFWKRIYEEAAKRYGTTNIPVNTFNKVWIVPEKAVVYENAKAGTAYVVESKLKVMLEEDYLSLAKHEGIQSLQTQTKNTNQLGSQIVREIILPELTTEVNENKNFAKLRQVYNSLILATWYKKKIRDSILEQVYANRNKVAGVNIDDPKEKDKIYQRYLQAFKKGVYNYIKEDIDPVTQETIPRKYFSGGFNLRVSSLGITNDPAMLNSTIGRNLAKVAVSIAAAATVFLTPASLQAYGTSTAYTPAALKVLQEVNSLTPQQAQALTTQALETVAHNIKVSGHGVISLNRMMNDMNIPGDTLDEKLDVYSANMLEAFKHSPHFLDHLKNSPNPFLAFNTEIDSIIGVEAMFNNSASRLRPDGRRDEGFLQTSGFKNPAVYYHTHPMEYLLEVIEDHWDTTMGIAEKRAGNIMDIYGASFTGYFKWLDRERLEFLYARVLWNGGPGLSLDVLARVPIAVNVTQGRLTFMSTKAAEAMVFAYGGTLDTTTPNLNAIGWGNTDKRMAFDDELLKLFKELNDITKLQIPDGEREKLFQEKKQEIDQKIQDFRQKFSLVSQINPFDPKIDGLAASELKITPADQGVILNVNAAQVAQLDAAMRVQDRAMLAQISEAEAQRVLARVEIHGGSLEQDLQQEDIKRLGIEPKYKIEQGGRTIYFSAPYNVSKNWVAVLGYVQDGNVFVGRTYYTSGSQGIWRYLPRVRLNDDNKPVWFDKGYSEDSLPLPYQLQKVLAKVTEQEKPLTLQESDWVLLFAGTTNQEARTYKASIEVMPQKVTFKDDPDGVGGYIAPEQLGFSNSSDQPNLDQMLDQYTLSSAVYGALTARVFPSLNGKYKFTFMEDRKGRVWIANIETNGPLSTLGLSASWVKGGSFTVPAYEYVGQDYGYGNFDDVVYQPGTNKVRYVDMWHNYLSKVPVIKEFHRRYVERQEAESPMVIEENTTVVAKTNILGLSFGQKITLDWSDHRPVTLKVGQTLVQIKQDGKGIFGVRIRKSTGEELSKRIYFQESLELGRETKTNRFKMNDVVSTVWVDPDVSRQHARVIVQGDQLTIQDLGSTHGTRYIAGELTPDILKDFAMTGSINELRTQRLRSYIFSGESSLYNKRNNLKILPIYNTMVGFLRILQGRQYSDKTDRELLNILDGIAARHYGLAGDLEKFRDEKFNERQEIINRINQALGRYSLRDIPVAKPQALLPALPVDKTQVKEDQMKLPFEADKAMRAEKNGGIDLTPANMNLQTQNAGEAIKFHIDPAMFQELQNAPGFVPVIINIQPMVNLKAFLGIASS